MSANEQDKSNRRPREFEIDLEVRYRTLFEQSPDGIVLADVQGNIVEFNEAAHAMLGYTREEFAGLRLSDISTQGPREVRECVDHVLNTGRTDFEATYRTKRGGTKTIQVHSRMMVLSGQTVMHAIWCDVTDRKKTEIELAKSEKFIKDILETVDEGFVVIDREYRILQANKAYLDQVKMSREKVVGRHCYEISHRIHKPCFEMGEECAVRKTFEQGEPRAALHVHHDKDGNSLYVETKSYPLKDPTGKTVTAIEIINNTTEKKQLEEQLRHIQKMEAIGQLAGGIAHDFNNILTAITGYGSLMKMKMAEDDPLRNHLQQMLDAAERAAGLTRGLLAFSRKQEIRPRPVNLNVIIANMEKLLQRIIGEDVEIHVELASGELTVMADCGQIEQVLMNLVANARDAMAESGRLSIQTDTVVLDDEFLKTHGYGKRGTYAQISVTDTGSGMNEKTRERIFEPFFTTKEVGKGTGLGLSIVYGLIKQHNGYIICSSEPGKGTTFTIYMPLSKREVHIQKNFDPHPTFGGAETVLVAEDDAPVRALMKEVLTQYGYMVIEACNGEDAIIQFKKNREKVQLLILDFILPKINGKEVYDEIRKLDPKIKAVFASGYTADFLQQKGIAGENINFVSKPILPADLLNKMRETLDKESHIRTI
jgi:two-component system cell cycle sensor histidine kinase/response regulator CckA